MTNSKTGRFGGRAGSLNDPPKTLSGNEKRLKVIHFCFCVCQFLIVIGYISQSMKVEVVFSFVSRSYILLNVIPFILYFIDCKKMPPETFFIIFMGLSAIFAYLLHGEGVPAYNFFLTLCGYLALPMYFLFLKDLPFDETIHRVVKATTIMASLFFCYRYFTDPQYSLGGDLTFGYFNANYLSILLIQNITLLVVLKGMESGKGMRCFFWILVIFESYFVYLTHSRASFLCAVFLLCFSFRSKKTISKGFTNLAIILPIAIALLLTYIAGKGWLNGVMIFEKPLLSGRERMFQNAIVFILEQNPIFGYFSDYQLGNAHNSFLSVLTSVGIFGFIFFFGFYYRSVHELRKKLNGDPIRYLAYIGILMLFLEGCAESPLLVSGSMYAAAASPLLLFIKYGESAGEKKEKQ